LKKEILWLAGVILSGAAHGQIATDGSVGPRSVVSGPNYVIPANLGSVQGSNLFHSFAVFNVASGESASFLGFLGLRNIIARITDSNPSQIYGTVTSTTPNASLFLVNPNGLVFGPGAVVDVNGSFYASTAHYVAFRDGSRLDTGLPANVTLTVSDPSGLGFDSSRIAPLVVQGASMRVVPSGAIGLVGGAISLGGNGSANLSAPSGRVALVGAASPGLVRLDVDAVTLSGFTDLADVSLGPGSRVDVAEVPGPVGGGSVLIRGRDVTLDTAIIDATSHSAAGRGIVVQADRDLVARQSNIVAVTDGSGNAGSIQLGARNVTLSDGTQVDTSCNPGCTTGAGGHIEVIAGGVFLISGEDVNNPTFLGSNSFGGGATGDIRITSQATVLDGNALIQGVPVAAGNGSVIDVHTGDLAIRNGAQIDASTQGAGNGGLVSIVATGAISIDGDRPDPTQGGAIQPSGIFSNTSSSGSAGRILIAASGLDITAGGEVSSSAKVDSTGNGGSISISASDHIRISGTSSDGKPSDILTNAFSSGNAGDIELDSKSLQVLDQGLVQSQSEGSGRAGSITITGHDVTIGDRAQVSTDARATGSAGDVTVTLDGALAISGENSGIFAQTYLTGQGGNIAVNVQRVTVDGQGGIFASTDGAGIGGSVMVRASQSVSLADQGQIASATSSSGAAGSVQVFSLGTIALTDLARISTSSEAGGGNAGKIEVTSGGAFTLASGARIASESAGAGLAGDISVEAGGGLNISGAAQVTTSARSSDGGNISVTSPGTILMVDGSISTAVGHGQGNGGNVIVSSPVLALIGSSISANAFGGNGGNILVKSATVLVDSISSVTASSQLGVDGTIVFQSPAIDLSAALRPPSGGFLDIHAITSGRCGARVAENASSLVVRRFDPVEARRVGFLLPWSGITMPVSDRTCGQDVVVGASAWH